MKPPIRSPQPNLTPNSKEQKLCRPSGLRNGFALRVSALAALLALPLLAADPQPNPGLPYVYTKWQQLTTKDGLPNDHIFSVKADKTRDCIWIGTEDGFAKYDKKTGKIRSWQE